MIYHLFISFSSTICSGDAEYSNEGLMPYIPIIGSHSIRLDAVKESLIALESLFSCLGLVDRRRNLSSSRFSVRCVPPVVLSS